jgi:6,7-dimethyl-8-ribityllumazine synthase
MSFDAPQPTAINGAPFSVGIVAARYNGQLVGALLGQVVAGLEAAGVRPRRIKAIRVPGANELPSGVQLLLKKQKTFDVVVALGVIIRGDTIHYELVAEAASQGLQRIALDTRIPVIAGVVVAENAAQAEDRCLGHINRGAEFARAALEMAALRQELSS